jgi:hypothetical protein
VPHAAFLLLSATPAWLALSRLERERIVAEELRPILDRHRPTVSARYYDTEAYAASTSDLLVLEFEDPGAHVKLIDDLRDSSIFSVPYFILGDLLVGKRASWLDGG